MVFLNSPQAGNLYAAFHISTHCPGNLEPCFHFIDIMRSNNPLAMISSHFSPPQSMPTELFVEKLVWTGTVSSLAGTFFPHVLSAVFVLSRSLTPCMHYTAQTHQLDFWPGSCSAGLAGAPWNLQGTPSLHALLPHGAVLAQGHVEMSKFL